MTITRGILRRYLWTAPRSVPALHEGRTTAANALLRVLSRKLGRQRRRDPRSEDRNVEGEETAVQDLEPAVDGREQASSWERRKDGAGHPGEDLE